MLSQLLLINALLPLGIAGLTSLQIHGQEFLSKEEVLQKVFRGMKGTALRSLSSRRKMKSIRATEDARSFLDKTIGKRKGGHYLMKAHDVEILIKEKMRPHKSASMTKDRTVISPSASKQNLPACCKQILPKLALSKFTRDCNDVETSMQSLPSTSIESLVPNTVTRDCSVESSIGSLPSASTESLVPNEVTRDCNVETSTQDLPSTSTESTQIDGGSANVSCQRERDIMFHKMPCRKLPFVLNESLETQLRDFGMFYSRELNPKRPSIHMSKETIKRHEMRIREFIDYVSRKYKRAATFDDCLDIEIAAGYIEERTGTMSKGTSANHVQTLIALAKYVLRDSKHRGNWERVKEVADLRQLQSQLQVSDHSDIKLGEPENCCFQVPKTLRGN